MRGENHRNQSTLVENRHPPDRTWKSLIRFPASSLESNFAQSYWWTRRMTHRLGNNTATDRIHVPPEALLPGQSSRDHLALITFPDRPLACLNAQPVDSA